MRNSKGFTIIELMFATIVFGLVLLTVATTLIQVSRLYYKGVIVAKTQSTARAVIEEVARSVQLSGGGYNTTIPPVMSSFPPQYTKCFGNTRLTWAVNGQVSGGASETSFVKHQMRHALWRDVVSDAVGDCGTQYTTPKLNKANPNDNEPAIDRKGQELLEEGMRLGQMSIDEVPGSAGTIFRINVTIIYGDDDMLTNPNNPSVSPTCKGSLNGSQWCAVSTMSTFVNRRVE